MNHLLTINDLSAYLQISKPTIYKMIAEKKIPFISINARVIRFDPEKIDAYLREKENKVA